MVYLVFNRFFLDTPVYRETARLLQERIRVSRQTVTNCLEKDTIVNCDERGAGLRLTGNTGKSMYGAW